MSKELDLRTLPERVRDLELGVDGTTSERVGDLELDNKALWAALSSLERDVKALRKRVAALENSNRSLQERMTSEIVDRSGYNMLELVDKSAYNSKVRTLEKRIRELEGSFGRLLSHAKDSSTLVMYMEAESLPVLDYVGPDLLSGPTTGYSFSIDTDTGEVTEERGPEEIGLRLANLPDKGVHTLVRADMCEDFSLLCPRCWCNAAVVSPVEYSPGADTAKFKAVCKSCSLERKITFI
jgi:polyhydroxyalkanoate synthesis regulator phasin